MASNKEIVKAINEAFTKGDVEGFLLHCEEDFTWDMTGENVTQGKQQIRESMAGMNADNAPDFSVDNMIAEGDWVVCDGAMQMTMPDGKEWKGRYCDMYRIVDGKVREMKSYIVENKPKPAQ